MGASDRQDQTARSSSVPRPVRLGAVVVLAQAVALLLTAILLVDKAVSGHPHSVGAALTEAALALAAAAVLALGARGLLRLRPAARSPVIVIELIALPVSYSLAIQAGRVLYGGPILVSALIVLYALFTPSAREVLNRPG